MRLPAAVASWVFRHDANGQWEWHVTHTSGLTYSTLQMHENLPVALNDAMGMGFSPTKHEWRLHEGNSVTRFTPGEAPVRETRS